jgi:hypothetical protein
VPIRRSHNLHSTLDAALVEVRSEVAEFGGGIGEQVGRR